MEKQMARLKEILAEVSDLHSVVNVLDWDQQTYMPPGGADERGSQQGTISRMAHISFTSPEVGQLLEDLKPAVSQLDPDSNDARLVMITARDYRKAVKIPPQWVAEFAHAGAVGQQAWQAAKADNDFSRFQPYLERMVDLRRQYAEIFAPYDHIYDPLLDDYEPGLKTADVQKIFNQLRPQQVRLIQAISQRPPVNDAFLSEIYDEDRQWAFGVMVITRFGYDWERGRQDKSAHPFTTGFSIDDVRITTRIMSNYLFSGLSSTMHECGHALYEQGVDHSLRRTPLAQGASLALHESQSRMWENLVGRSLPFWEYFYPHLQAYFPSQLSAVSLDQFYRAINKVQPSLIRVEADEATYNLHVMLRLELEIALMEGSLQVKDLPQAWNARMREYLGLTPPDDASGVLQDIHWSGGSIGYFPTYTLGNLISLQLWDRIHEDIPDLDDQFRQGEFQALLHWLREKIHRHGAKFEPQELVERVTGSKINPEPYIRYLNSKYGQIYGLS